MGLTTQSQIGKKHTIYLPKIIVEKTGLTEGTKILIIVEDGKLTIEPVYDPIDLAMKGKKFASISIEEVEATSSEQQSKYTENTS